MASLFRNRNVQDRGLTVGCDRKRTRVKAWWRAHKDPDRKQIKFCRKAHFKTLIQRFVNKYRDSNNFCYSDRTVICSSNDGSNVMAVGVCVGSN